MIWTSYKKIIYLEFPEKSLRKGILFNIQHTLVQAGRKN